MSDGISQSQAGQSIGKALAAREPREWSILIADELSSSLVDVLDMARRNGEPDAAIEALYDKADRLADEINDLRQSR